jgi:hypothetical protein
MTMEPKENSRKKKHEDISLKECLKDFSFYVFAEMVAGLIWRILIFIPRMVIRSFSNW